MVRPIRSSWASPMAAEQEGLLRRRARSRLQASDGSEPKIRGSKPGDLADAPSELWRLRDRLTEAQIKQLIAEYHPGATIKAVAARYGLGTTTIKRLLRQRNARRCNTTLLRS